MRTQALIATTLLITAQSWFGIACHAADLLWDVENPYRFFKRSAPFDVKEKAFNAVRGAPGQRLPQNTLWKVERRLNDPDCKDASTPSSCLNLGRELQGRLQCISDGRKPNCPAGLATGSGTGFRLVTDHVAEFLKRGVCARDPQKALVDQLNMNMPRLPSSADGFVPYSPAGALPYAHRLWLAPNSNDTFLAANTNREGISPFDDLQPVYAALYSSAFQPMAEGHAIVADHVLRHVNELFDKRALAQN